ncbi:MAG: CpsB/CapC family capsule biosynthesis tyrosine phosphatase [Chitinophagaceae bacterium]
MFRIFSKDKKNADGSVFEMLKTDMHSHLIPGVDDGSPDLEASLYLVKGLANLGYTKLITTPHIMWDMYKNTREGILQKLDGLRKAVEEEKIPVEIHAAAEYFLDEHVEGLLKKNEPLLTISGNMVLVEFSMAYQPHGIKDIIFDMQMQGYQPIIAHPERYIYLQQNKQFYEELKDTGCMFQLNLLSLTGGYGKTVNELAQYLIKNDYYDLAGTDLHHNGHLEALRNNAANLQIKKLVDSGRLRNPSL